jgi:hypothetical protein
MGPAHEKTNRETVHIWYAALLLRTAEGGVEELPYLPPDAGTERDASVGPAQVKVLFLQFFLFLFFLFFIGKF